MKIKVSKNSSGKRKGSHTAATQPSIFNVLSTVSSNIPSVQQTGFPCFVQTRKYDNCYSFATPTTTSAFGTKNVFNTPQMHLIHQQALLQLSTLIIQNNQVQIFLKDKKKKLCPRYLSQTQINF